MQRGYFLGAAAALAAGCAAQAQDLPSQPIGPAHAESAPAGETSDTSASVSAANFRPGMVVKDPFGTTVGRITRVGQTSDGVNAVEVEVEGKRVSLSPAVLTLSVSGREALSSMSKAAIQSAAARGPG